MRCVWCGAEGVKTRKDGKVFFCTECNMPLIFELEENVAANSYLFKGSSSGCGWVLYTGTIPLHDGKA